MSLRLTHVSFKHCDLFVTYCTLAVPFDANRKPVSPQILRKKARTPLHYHEIRISPQQELQKTLNFSPNKPTAITEGERTDDKDKEILKILKNDGRASYSDIGKQIGLSEGAIRKRIKDLTETEIIRKFTVKIGVAEGAEAVTLLAISPSLPTQEVSRRLREIPNVETIYEVTGEYDIIAVIGGMNVVEVNECIERIRRVEGITKTNTMIVLRSW